MDISKLFKIQNELDERILVEKNLKSVDLIPKKILSLQVELGELANELPEVFKFWSQKKNNYERALEEYCDCLHFILSIGNDLGLNYIEPYSYHSPFTDTIEKIFIELLISTGHFLETENTTVVYTMLFCQFIGLSEKLGFSWEEVEEAYIAKNKINHKRQETGY